MDSWVRLQGIRPSNEASRQPRGRLTRPGLRPRIRPSNNVDDCLAGIGPFEGPGPLGGSGEERGHERFGVERQEVARLLPHPNEPDGDAEVVLDREHDAALGGRIELGQDDPGQPD